MVALGSSRDRALLIDDPTVGREARHDEAREIAEVLGGNVRQPAGVTVRCHEHASGPHDREELRRG